MKRFTVIFIALFLATAALVQAKEYNFVIANTSAMVSLNFDGKVLKRTTYLFNYPDFSDSTSYNISTVEYFPEQGIAFYTNDNGKKDQVCGQVFANADGSEAFFMFGAGDKGYKSTHTGKNPHTKFAQTYKELKADVLAGNIGKEASAQFKGKELALDKMCAAPFGYKPVAGRAYTLEDIRRAAKSVWGWEPTIDNKTKRIGFTWPNLDGMTFQGYPVYRISAYNSDGKFFLSHFSCTLMVPNTPAAKSKAEKAIIAYFKSRGWTRVEYYNETSLYFYKGNVTVTCYPFDSNTVPGKLEFIIEAHSFPTAKDARDRLEGGLG